MIICGYVQLAIMGIIPGESDRVRQDKLALLLLVLEIFKQFQPCFWQLADACVSFLLTACCNAGFGLINFFTLWLLIVLYLHRKQNMVSLTRHASRTDVCSMHKLTWLAHPEMTKLARISSAKYQCKIH